MKTRFNAYEKSTYDFLQEILVECPNCKNKAIVKSSGLLRKNELEHETKVICLKCGFNKKLINKKKDKVTLVNGKTLEVRQYFLNTTIDPYFRLPLWLQKEVPDGTLWAYNYEHLGFIGKHIEAELRERTLNDISNRSIGSRLPKWMSSKKNRKDLLKGIEILKKK